MNAKPIIILVPSFFVLEGCRRSMLDRHLFKEERARIRESPTLRVVSLIMRSLTLTRNLWAYSYQGSAFFLSGVISRAFSSLVSGAWFPAPSQTKDKPDDLLTSPPPTTNEEEDGGWWCGHGLSGHNLRDDLITSPTFVLRRCGLVSSVFSSGVTSRSPSPSSPLIPFNFWR